MFDLNKLGALAAQTEDQSVVIEGGKGNKEVPAEGISFMRLRDYVELGEFNKAAPYVGVDNKVMLTFELLSPKYLKDFGKGIKEPQIISIYVNKSNSPKGKYVPLFAKLNYLNNAKHAVQCIGMPYLGKITHRKGSNGEVYANLNDVSGAWTIEPPYTQDPNTGETVQYNVPQLVGKPTVFLFENSGIDDKTYLDMWNSMHREGNNWLQEKVMSSNKFNGSRLQSLLNGSQQAFVQFQQQFQQQPQQSTVIQAEKAQADKITTVLGQYAPTGNFNEDVPF